MNKKGFTLLELLVVVLIIGILAGIALPQYKKVVEKSKMAEAVSTVKVISDAQQRYYLVHGNYASCKDLNALDIDLPGSDNCAYSGCACKQSTYFLYTNSSRDGNRLALSQRLPLYRYAISIDIDGTILCEYGSHYQPTQIQKELCDKLKQTGTL